MCELTVFVVSEASGQQEVINSYVLEEPRVIRGFSTV